MDDLLDLEPAPPAKEEVFSTPGANAVLPLEVTGCRWPFGNGPILFCNDPFEPNPTKPPYCAAHMKIAYPGRAKLEAASAGKKKRRLLPGRRW